MPFSCFCDSAAFWQFGLQDPATPIAEGILRFHHDLMFILVFVVVFVSWIMFRIIFRFSAMSHKSSTTTVHGTFIEIIWTIFPAFILIVIAIPSFALLYAIDEIVSPGVSVKVIGHQWYWSYEYSDYTSKVGKNLLFDSYLVSEGELGLGDFRLLEVDNRVVFPVNTHIRLVITSADVLHCWAVPSFGVKIDACPGRLNESTLFVQRKGVFYGQCSEICGVNHGFIPIAVEAVSVKDYIFWLRFFS